MQIHPAPLNKLDKTSFVSFGEDINSLFRDVLQSFMAGSLEYVEMICQATVFFLALGEEIKRLDYNFSNNI